MQHGHIHDVLQWTRLILSPELTLPYSTMIGGPLACASDALLIKAGWNSTWTEPSPARPSPLQPRDPSQEACPVAGAGVGQTG